MIQIIVMTHGELGKSIIESCELIAGKANNISYLSLHREDNVEDLKKRFEKELLRANEYEGILVFVDLLGGSPSNVAMACSRDNVKYHIITGVNMPMLLEAMVCRNEYDVESLAEHCIKISHDGIQHINKLMK